MKKDQNRKEIDKIRYGAPDGPRKRRENYDGSEPLEYPGHEATAQFLAFPALQRELKSVPALAKRFDVSPKTVYCWMRDRDVLQRADWLSQTNKITGTLAARRACEQMVEKTIEKANDGDMEAFEFLWKLAWHEDRQPPVSGATTSPTFGEAAASARGHLPPPEWTRRQQEQRHTEEDAAAPKGDKLPEHKDPPE